MTGKRIDNPLVKVVAYTLVIFSALAWIAFAIRQGAGEPIGLDNSFLLELFPMTLAEKEAKAVVVFGVALVSMLALIPAAAINSAEKQLSFWTSWSYMALTVLVTMPPVAGLVFGLQACGQVLTGKLPMSGGSTLYARYASSPIGSVRYALIIMYLAIILSWQPTLFVWFLDIV